MKDVKVDVRVNVGVDTASVVLLLASAAMAVFLYKQHKEEKRDEQEKQEKREKLKLDGA
jgi:ribosomal protein L11